MTEHVLDKTGVVLRVALLVATLSLMTCKDTRNSDARPRKPLLSTLSTPPPILGHGPFGLDSGLTELQLKTLPGFNPSDSSGMLFYATSVPKAHPEFESYRLLVSRKTGLCKINAIGRTHDNDAYGYQLRSTFKELDTALTAKYGKPTRYDFLHAGSIWNEQKEWMTALRLNQRSLVSFWSDSVSRLGNALMALELSAHGESGDAGYLTLAYYFNNSDQCTSEYKQKQNVGL
jgi:hypothetical protein